MVHGWVNIGLVWGWWQAQDTHNILVSNSGISKSVFSGSSLDTFIIIGIILFWVLGAAWMLWRLHTRQAFPHTRLDGPMLAAVGAAVIATLFSVDPRRSLIVFPQLMAFILFYLLVVELLRNGWPVKILHIVMFVLGGLIILFGALELAAWYRSWAEIGGLAEPVPPVTLRVSPLLAHPNLVAALINLLLPVGVIGLIRSWQRPWIARAYALWCLLLAGILFFTSSRGGWLGTLTWSVVLAWLLFDGQRQIVARWVRMRWNGLRQNPALGGILAFGGLVLCLVFFKAFLWGIQHPTHSSLLNSRAYIWKPAVEAFLRDPLTGSGPFTFGTDFLSQNTVPPGMLLSHAHNLLLNVMAETGLPGLIALLLGLFWVIRLSRRQWQRAAGGRRLQLAAAIAALAGLWMHSQFDTPQMDLVINLATAATLAVLAYDDIPRPAPVVSKLSNRLLVAGWGLTALGLLWAAWANQPYRNAVEAAQKDDWQAAAQGMDQAVARDPELAINWLQAGFAHGMLALDGAGNLRDAQQMAQAIADYEKGTAIEPGYATNWANLAILRWSRGDTEGALGNMERAVRAAPGALVFRLTLGRMYESTDHLEQARRTYEEALRQAPFLADSYYFRASPFCRQVMLNWRKKHPATLVPIEGPFDQGWMALSKGLPEDAWYLFRSALRNRSEEVYLGLGIAETQLGLPIDARAMLLRADFLSNDTGWLPIWTNLTLARLDTLRGDRRQAVQDGERALRILETTGAYGPGRAASDEYPWAIYNRDPLSRDLLPGFDRVVYPDEVVQGMADLEENYRALGEDRQAGVLALKIMDVAPDFELVKVSEQR